MLPTPAIIAHTVRRNILASTEIRHVHNCIAWVTRLLEQHGTPFESYHYILLQAAEEQKETIEALCDLVEHTQGIHLEHV